MCLNRHNRTAAFFQGLGSGQQPALEQLDKSLLIEILRGASSRRPMLELFMALSCGRVWSPFSICWALRTLKGASTSTSGNPTAGNLLEILAAGRRRRAAPEHVAASRRAAQQIGCNVSRAFLERV